MNTGNAIALFIVFIRKALLDTEYPLVERRQLVVDALRHVNLISVWAGTLPVSDKLSL